ncbi:MAG: hypothetical protein OEN50_08090 [Deltaproteobacteria bacterium]|nr:hypothetical protein [Deltaproteobacteria bacterium]
MADKFPRLFLVDGSAYIFRAYFAMPPLNNAAGLPTNAILGFTNMVIKFLKQHQPEFVAVALDAGRETFRNEMFTAYKGNRPEAPADLIPQFPYIRKVLESLNLPVLELAGYEADDIIATLCRKFSGAECEIIVVSSDKDLMQLVQDGVKMFDSAKERWIGYDEVKEKFGVEPAQVTDVMGLMGDATDNIPGVKGIGEKTAIALIQQFHSLDNLYARLPEVEMSKLRGAAGVRKKLEEKKDVAFLSRTLATVKADVPIDIELERLRFRAFDQERVRELFTELGFTNLLKLIDNDQGH